MIKVINTNTSTEEQVSSLVDVVTEQQDSIQELQQNVKWLYKYKSYGTGTGTGGGESSRSFQLNVSIDGNSWWITNGTQVVQTIYPSDGKKTYYITVYTRYADMTHDYVYEYKTGNSAYYQLFTLDATGQGVIPINIQYNDSIEIRVRDKYDGSLRSIQINYIVDYITVNNLTLVDQNHNDIISSNNEILMSQYQNIFVKLSYTLDFPGVINYEYTNISNQYGSGEDTTSNVVYLPLCEDNFLQDESNLGYYTFNLTFNYTPQSTGLTQNVKVEPLNISLIPSNLYIQVVPDSGEVYSQVNPEGHAFTAGYRVFNIKVFNGIYDEDIYSNCKCSVYKGNTLINEELISYSFKERDLLTYSVYIGETSLDPVEYILKISFINRQNVTINNIFYMYVIANPKDFDWFYARKDDTEYSNITLASDNYFNRAGQQDNIFTNQSKVITLQDSVYNISTPLQIDTNTSASSRELMISIGIQYNEINKSEVCLCSITNSEDKLPIFIYQNAANTEQVHIGSNKCSLFIPRAEYTDYNKDTGKYHLITLYRRAVHTKDNNTYYEWVTYVDGVIEHSISGFVTGAAQYDRITFNPKEGYGVNAFINHVSVCEFNVSGNIQSNNNYTGLSDIDIVQYYYKYRNSISTIPNYWYADILNSFRGFKFTYTTNNNIKIRDSFIKVSPLQMNNIASTSGISSLLVTIPFQGEGTDVLSSIQTTTYGEEDTFAFNNCQVEYRPKGTSTAFTQGTISENLKNADLAFRMALQGSSTKGYRVKNFDLEVYAKNTDTNVVPVYSLNYDSSNPKTFKPEQSFTLKADQVDSSHSNNTSIGAFVNAWTTPFNPGYRNCLEGVPVLLFINVQDENGNDDYYLLGIYNYNLGRSSQNNLGHSKANNTFENKGFIIEGLSVNNIDDNFIVAEITNNDDYWDFSQFDDSILFQGMCLDSQGNTYQDKAYMDKKYMWGDIKFRESETFNITQVRSAIKSLVKQVADAGGAIFTALNKTMSGQNYHTKYTVPDYKKQHRRYLIQNEGQGVDYQYTEYTYTPPVSIMDTLAQCLYTTGTTEEPIQPKLNFNSLLQYYVVCMAFGMVDSVQKNLNIKTWNKGDTWNIAFYDMDTALGIDNSGKYVTPFAFSDYWEETEDGIKVYKDYWALDTNDIGYDIPSSYLFAIAKYAEYIRIVDLGDSFQTLSTPTQQWSYLRGAEGELRNAQYFIDNYMAKHTEDVNEIIWNLNYRYKYLQIDINNPNSFITKDFAFFHGRRLHYTQSWLQKRLHVLDAYFNLNNIAFPLGTTDKIIESKYSEINPPLDTTMINNPDIIILRQIFNGGSPDGIKNNQNISCTVKVNEFSPTIIATTNLTKRYLFTEPNKEYSVYAEMNGNQMFTAFGSSNWTYLDTLNSFISEGVNLSIKSSLLENLQANVGRTPMEWIFDVPSLRTLSLTNPKFSNTVTIENPINLQEINISNSSLSLSGAFPALKRLNITNLNNPSYEMSIGSAAVLETLNASGAKLQGLYINPVPNSISLSDTHIKNMTFTGLDTDPRTLTISNDDTLTTLSVVNFTEIKVHNCPNLATVILDDKVQKVTITSCGSKLVTGQYIKIGTTNNVVDLSKISALTEVAFTSSKIQEIKLPNKWIDVKDLAFSGCSSLTKITGNLNVVSAKSLFRGCSSLSINNNDLNLRFTSTVTSIEYMFYCASSARGKIDNTGLAKIKSSLGDQYNKLTSCAYAFHAQNINNPSKFLLTTASLTNCTNFNSTFAYNPITETITKEILNIGKGLTEIRDIFMGANYNDELYNNIAPTTTYIKMKYDALDYLANTLTYFRLWRTGIQIVDTTGGVTQIAKFLGKCSKLTTISGLSFRDSDGATIIDFSPITDEEGNIQYYAFPSSVTSISEFMEFINCTCRNIDVAFSNLINLKSFTNSFHNNTSSQSVIIQDAEGNDARADIWNMFAWESISNKLSSIFAMPDGNYPGCNFSKTITLENFNKLMGLILDSKSIQTIRRLFNNCIITDYEAFLEDDVVHITWPEGTETINNTLTSMYCMFAGMQLQDVNYYVDFEQHYFCRFNKCTSYTSNWSSTRLYKLHSGWFQENTSAPISSLDGTFANCIFKIPYDDAKSPKEYYYDSVTYIYHYNTNSNTIGCISLNTGIPVGWKGNYIVYDTIFNNLTPNAVINSMFAGSTLFGLLPENLFNNINVSVSLASLFSETQIVPYKEKSIQKLIKTTVDGETVTKMQQINVYCYIPNGTEDTPYLNVRTAIGTAFNTGIIVPVSYDTSYFVKDSDLNQLSDTLDATQYPYDVPEDNMLSIYDNDQSEALEESIQPIDYINFIYVFNQYSIPHDGQYSNILPKNLPKIRNIDGSVSNVPSYSPSNAYPGNSASFSFRNNSIDMATWQKCYFNAQYNGGTNMLDIDNSTDGLSTDSNINVSANQLISGYLANLYYGPIFKSNIWANKIQLANDQYLIYNWGRVNYPEAQRQYVLGENIKFPKANTIVRNFAQIYKAGTEDSPIEWKLYANSNQFNNPNNYKESFTIDL